MQERCNRTWDFRGTGFEGTVSCPRDGSWDWVPDPAARTVRGTATGARELGLVVDATTGEEQESTGRQHSRTPEVRVRWHRPVSTPKFSRRHRHKQRRWSPCTHAQKRPSLHDPWSDPSQAIRRSVSLTTDPKGGPQEWSWSTGFFSREVPTRPKERDLPLT